MENIDKLIADIAEGLENKEHRLEDRFTEITEATTATVAEVYSQILEQIATITGTLENILAKQQEHDSQITDIQKHWQQYKQERVEQEQIDRVEYSLT